MLKLLAMTAVGIGTMAATATPAMAAPGPPEPVGKVQVDRYLGRWYQIAAVPALYEIQCRRDVTADYGLSPAGTVTVKNSCRSFFGITSTIRGDARPLDATNARLNVSFLRFGSAWRHTANANYIVVGLAADYRWAVVTDSGRRSGFVLSRTPALSDADARAARSALRRAAIDPCTLKTTPQHNGASTSGPFC
ncbi:lipocalin family protein [Actinomadura barringtoniae]|uniref:Lipocalin family protein n=1 Tax=Actinomadura barringtoniae TaxID=1427535 RepID=A0A939PDK8_9ACTN|nr:lipocalin family protein [Actinomadura barringtoniae]MBO2450882.1 lipocalin family protein [Actinomadura barringtoniae]